MKLLIPKLTVLVMILLSFDIHGIWAYDNEYTHRYINEMAAEKSQLKNYLKTSLGIKKGLYEEINGKYIWQWISDGGFNEDEPEIRCLQHFHNPIEAWEAAGLSSFFQSMIYWAQTPEPEAPNVFNNEYSLADGQKLL